MAAAGVMAMYRGRFRPWMYTWGAGEDEAAAVLPGDDLVVAGVPRTTRAVTVDAPPRAVWPWLVQIGEGRAGFYSYALLERALGARIHNANRIHPQWQDLQVGDTVWLARRYGAHARQVVALIEPKAHLVLMSPGDFERVQRGEKASWAWGFHLQPSNGRTRMITRTAGAPVGYALFDIAHFIMEYGMMCGIRKRAQRTTRAEYEQYRAVSAAVPQNLASVTTISL